MYSLNKYKIIYIYYYKFKVFKEKRARSVFSRNDNKCMFLKQKRRITKYRKKSLIFTKHNFIKPFGAKNFINKNFINNKKRYKNLFGNPDKSLLIINFRNLLLVPGVGFKKAKSSTSLIFF